ncbi:MAG: hypothetical protein WDZ51_08135 [Pirellulaceae bacterium]
MRRSNNFLSLFVSLLLMGATAARGDEASRSALDALESHLATTGLEDVFDQDFAQVPLAREDAAEAAKLLWEAHQAEVRDTRQEEMAARKITHGDQTMPFWYRVFGEKPEGGRSLYISMHGGGGTAPRVNDSQWENQKRLYTPQEGVYLVPRAPTNTWNLWHQEHIDPMFDRLIENLIVLEEVNPDRVYLLGYSAGGDGVFQLAPRMADRLAAASMMAGHPNETSPLGLRNLPFSIHMGAGDAAYERNQHAKRWGKELAKLHQDEAEGYTHLTKIYEGKGHWLDREDGAAIPWMAKYSRNTYPEKIVWKQDDVTHPRFYWLAVDPADIKERAEITAIRDGQTIEIHTTDANQVTVLLNDEMLDLDQPVAIRSERGTLFEGKVSRTIARMQQSLAERGDPRLIFSASVEGLSFEPPDEPRD